jgi:hypothetical protein
MFDKWNRSQPFEIIVVANECLSTYGVTPPIPTLAAIPSTQDSIAWALHRLPLYDCAGNETKVEDTIIIRHKITYSDHAKSQVC